MWSRALPFIFSALFASSVASAQSTTVEAEADTSSTGSDSGFRLGLDFGLSGGVAFGARNAMAAVGLGLELGYQFDRSWGLFLRSELGTTVISSYGGSYLMVEYTPLRQLSLAAGGGLEGVFSVIGSGVSGYGGLAFPLRVSWNFLSDEEWAARSGNNAWRLSLSLVGGVDPSDDPNADGFFRGALSLGYVWM